MFLAFYTHEAILVGEELAVPQTESNRSIIDRERLPPAFPTHRHSASFWEALGRAVATFGFLEETLGKAIFAFTGTREIPSDEIEAEFEKWLPTLRRALSDPLGGLIDSYGKAVSQNPAATISNLPNLLDDLRKAAALRNALCHGSWRAPDSDGRSIPSMLIERTAFLRRALTSSISSKFNGTWLILPAQSSIRLRIWGGSFRARAVQELQSSLKHDNDRCKHQPDVATCRLEPR